MAQKARLTTALTLLVAFLVSGLLPAAGAWSCPDGTACVHTAGLGFNCAAPRCAMACCQGGRQQHGCTVCRHGVLPALGAAGSRQRAIGQPARCRYQKAQRLGPVWAPARARRLGVHPALLQPAASPAPVLLPLPARWVPIRGSPPACYVSSPSSPRAPPAPARA